MNYDTSFIESVAFLISTHLLLVEIATRRDVDDDETALFCSEKIKDAERLKMLYLLTISDSMSTGPKAWNSWTSSLFKNLFQKTLDMLERGKLATREAIEKAEQKKAQILSSAETDEEWQRLDRLISFMPPQYLHYTSAPAILDHIALYRTLGDKPAVLNSQHSEEGTTRIVTICGKDAPGFFSKIIGIFTLNGIRVLAAKIFTWKNQIALDVFRVTPPADIIYENLKWNEIEKDFQSAVLNKIDLSAKIKARQPEIEFNALMFENKGSRIVVDNESSNYFTILDVHTFDMPGLLFSISDALYRCGLDLYSARIGIKATQVVNVFYLRDFYGRKITEPQRLEGIKSAVKDLLPDTMNH